MPMADALIVLAKLVVLTESEDHAVTALQAKSVCEVCAHVTEDVLERNVVLITVELSVAHV
jgi:hypothetical protein